MVFKSRYTIDIATVDVLSYVFDKSSPGQDVPIYIDSENPSERVTKSELEVLVKKIASGLRRVADVKENDTVLQFAANSVWYPVVLLGSIAAGGIFTGANPGYTATELEHQLKVSDAKCIVTESARLSVAMQAAQKVGIPKSAIFLVDVGKQATEGNEVQSMSSLFEHGMYDWERIYDPKRLSEKVALLNFSSGTTGRPKACMITHRNLVANAEQILYLDQVDKEKNADAAPASPDVFCAYLPLFHAMGLFTFCILNVRRGCTNVVMRKFTLSSLLENIQKFRITFLSMAPPIAVMLVKSPLVSKYDVSSIRSTTCGAAPLGPETSAQLESLFSANQSKSKQGWGLTESTMAICVFGPGEFDPSHRGVGYVIPNMEMKVVNLDGKEVGYNEEGEALVRGPNVFKGYYKNPDATREALTEDGWLKTGDAIVYRPDGIVRVVDRKKELIKVKGFQVAPSELEDHLLDYEGIKDCAVIRVDRNGQEHPQAHVVRSGDHVTEASIIAFMNERLSDYKRLTGGVVFTDAIPKSPSGKILRRMIQDPFKGRPAATSRL